VEELDDLLRERRAAGDPDPQPPAEPFLHLRVHESVGERWRKREPPRELVPALAQLARLPADAQRPVDQRSLDALLLRELLRDAGVDLLVHARHAREHGRAARRQRAATAYGSGQNAIV
jgi:hypothetical protein